MKNVSSRGVKSQTKTTGQAKRKTTVRKSLSKSAVMASAVTEMGTSKQGISLRKMLTISGVALIFAAGLLAGKTVMAQTKSSNTSSLESLGNQSKIMEKAKPSVPANTYRVVQKRVIDREYRSEFGLTGGMVAGGDSYYQTSSYGLQYDFHLGNRVSIGARYQMHTNSLTPEGKRVYERANAMAGANNTNYVVPDLDQPLNTMLGTVSFYPVYGKVSWFESTVSYFDFYLMGGAGQISLKNGSSPVMTGGLGMGMWWNQYLTSRLEARYQTYEDQIFTGKRKIEGTVLTFTMGFLL